MWKRCVMCALVASALSAAGIGVTIPQPDQYGLIGDVVVFRGAVTNNTPTALGASELWVNFSAVDYRIDVTDLLPTHNFVLNPGQSTGTIDLFAAQFNILINVDPVVPGDIFPFDVQLQDINDDLSQAMTVSITYGEAPGAPIPEPGSLLLVAVGFCGSLLRKKSKAAIATVATMLLAGMQQPLAAQNQAVLFQTGAPGIFWYGQELLIAIPILNAGTGTANVAAVMDATLGGVRAIRPNGYTGIGTLGRGQQAVAQLAFPSNPFHEGQRLRLVINGVYGFNTEYKFQVSRVLDLPFVQSNNTATGVIQPVAAGEPYNPVRPVYPPHPPTNPPIHSKPLPVVLSAGPPQILNPAETNNALTPEPSTALHFPIAIERGKASQERSTGTSIKTLTNSGIDAASNFLHPQDPSGDVAIFTRSDGTRRRVVMTTGNTWAAYADVAEGALPMRATDFRAIDIDKALNPAGATLDGGLGVDQVVRYIPSRDMWVWVIQTSTAFQTDGKRRPNRLRVAYTSTARLISGSGEKWTTFDIKPSTIGVTGANEWLDYPTIGFTASYLFVGITVLNSVLVQKAGSPPGVLVENSTGLGRKIIRIPLTVISDSVVAGSILHTDLQPAYSAAFTDNNEDRIYWAALQSNSNLRIWEWRDTVDGPASSDLDVKPTTDTDYSSMDPGGFNWLQRDKSNGVLGATRETFTHLDGPVERSVTFAWGAGRDAVHPQPYLRLATFRVSTDLFGITTYYVKTSERDRWHGSDAFHFPALATRGFQRGLVAARGGVGLHARTVFGFSNGTSLFSIGNSTATDRGLADVRFGDYFTIVPDPAGASCFSVFGYVVTANATASPGGCPLTTDGIGCTITPRYAVFCEPDSPSPR